MQLLKSRRALGQFSTPIATFFVGDKDFFFMN